MTSTIASNTGGILLQAPTSLDTTPDPQVLARVDALCFADAWKARDYQSMLRQPAVHAWVLSVEERPAGLLCFQETLDEAEVYRIGVIPEFRGVGLGAKLLEALLQLGNRKGWSGIFLEVRAGNDPARKLYAAMGFRETGRRPDYYQNPREDAVRYALSCG